MWDVHVNMMYRVLLLQGGQIYCCTLLIPEIGMENFFEEEGVSGPFKKSKKSPEC
jgi:hypothetical protein